MQFVVCGPYQVERKSSGLVDVSKVSKKAFWDVVEESRESLSYASGCYIFALKTSGGIIPWYVGKAERQSFRFELFSLHKVNIFNEVVSEITGRPIVYFLPKVTPGDKLCKPTTSRTIKSIGFLEHMLIGLALRRNDRLKNIKDTKFQKQLRVRGLINSDTKGHPGTAALELREALALGK